MHRLRLHVPRCSQIAPLLLGAAGLFSAPLHAQIARDSQEPRLNAGRYERQSLAFELTRNSGSSAPEFRARSWGFTVSLKAREARLSPPEFSRSEAPGQSDVFRPHRPGGEITIELRNQQNRTILQPNQELSEKINYLIGNDQSKWHTGIATYARICNPNVYPGIDLVYYGTPRQLDFDVATGADPGRIEMQFRGASRLTLDGNGNLRIASGRSSVLLHKPVIYQEAKFGLRRIRGGFRLLGRRMVGFTIGQYDHRNPLVIDPILTYSTYLGTATGGSANAVAVDAAGNAYVTGTYFAQFPTTSGALQAQYAGRYGNAFVTKFDPNGNLVYSTYLGGSLMDGGRAIAVDSAGNAYVAGYTASTDFPVTTGAYQTVDKVISQPDFRQFTAFVTKLDPTGSKLVYFTFLGGSVSDNPQPQTEGQEQATSIGVDTAGNAWVTGFTFSTGAPPGHLPVGTWNSAIL